MTHRTLCLALWLAALPAAARAADAPAPDPSAAAISADAPAPDAAPAVPVAETAPATAAPAAAASPAAAPDPDPWEGFNRSVFRFNDRLDRYVGKPIARGYRKVTPRVVRKGISNFYRNIRMPLVMINDLLQGKPKAAGQDLSRFVVNATVGIAGFWDPSTRWGIPLNDEDFGQTLGRWGVPTGPYLVLPLLGPSTVRDGTGFGVDAFSDPVTYHFEVRDTFAFWTGKFINARSNLMDVEEIIQGDRYLFIRDLYLQSRDYAVKDGKVDSDPFLDEADPGDPGSDGGDSGGASAPEDTPAAPQEGAATDGAAPVDDATAAPAPEASAPAAPATPDAQPSPAQPSVGEMPSPAAP